jgi:hypothetical protein
MKKKNTELGRIMLLPRNKRSEHTIIYNFGDGAKVVCHELTSSLHFGTAVTEKFGKISGYPTIMFKFKSDKVVDYKGPRVVSKEDYIVVRDDQGQVIDPPSRDMMMAYMAMDAAE